MSLFPEQKIVEDTWSEKYRYGDEPDYAATCQRVVMALCANESTDFRHEALRAMQAKEIVPAGRILAGAGTAKRVTLINCFVSPVIQDSMRTEPDFPGLGIMDALSVACYTLQMGGGIGMDFSTVRPRGSVVKRTSSVSSGVLPFMDMWHHMSNTIMSAGHRRGAMMGTLGIWHPDIEEFVAAKQTPGRLTNFNVSILVPDAFMEAVAQDQDWELLFPVPKAGQDIRERWVPKWQGAPGWKTSETRDGLRGTYLYRKVWARELWDKIIQSTYVHAEPGVIFVDRVNQKNNLAYCEYIQCSNPCGEQVLPPNGDCNLGHTNLAVMVDDPFTSRARINFVAIRRAATIMVRLLDNVLDVTLWPTEEQRAEAAAKRRIGLGFTGLASALQQMGVAYGSEAAVGLTRMIAQEQAVAAYRASCQLAEERGSFPLFDREKFCSSPFVQKLEERDPKLPERIRQQGIRNGVLLSIAPTGTTSLAIGNVSSGIEPVFAHSYKRNVRAGNGEMETSYNVYDYGYLKWCERQGLDPSWPIEGEPRVLPAGFVTADQLTVEQHLQMAAAAQEWVDSAISKTINCPTEMSFEDFRGVYARAYALGLKGCTTYRPDPASGRGAVLEVASDAPKGAPEAGLAATEDTFRAGSVSHTIRKEYFGDGVTAKHIGGIATYDLDLVSTEPAATNGHLRAPDKVPMQEVADGRRYRVKWPHDNSSYYIVITDYVDDKGQRRPFELFISTKSSVHDEWTRAFSLMVTAIFRREGDPRFIIDELKSVVSARGAFIDGKHVPSLVAAIGQKIEDHMRWLGLLDDVEEAPPQIAEGVEAFSMSITPVPGGDRKIEEIARNAAALGMLAHAEMEMGAYCNRCGRFAVVHEQGCKTCKNCGHSDCG